MNDELSKSLHVNVFPFSSLKRLFAFRISSRSGQSLLPVSVNCIDWNKWSLHLRTKSPKLKETKGKFLLYPFFSSPTTIFQQPSQTATTIPLFSSFEIYIFLLSSTIELLRDCKCNDFFVRQIRNIINRCTDPTSTSLSLLISLTTQILLQTPFK